MGEVKVKSHNVSLTSYRLTSLLFHVNRPSHSWDTAFSKSNVENSRSRSWVRSKLKVTTWGLHSVDSHPFPSMSPRHPIPELWLFENLTLKIMVMGEVTVQSHNVDLTSYWLTSYSFHVNRASDSWVTIFWKFDLENQGSRSWVRSQFKVTMWILQLIGSHPFHSMSIRHPIPELRLFQNLTLKIKDQGHGWGHSSKSQWGSSILSTHIPFVPCQSGIPFLSYDFFKIWPWKSRVKVMSEVTLQSHNVGLTSYRFTSFSFHVNRPSHSWDTAFSKIDLENPRPRSNDHDVAQLQV